MTTHLLVGLALVLAAPAKKDPPGKDPPSLVGEWVADKVVLGGQDLAPQGVDAMRIEFAADGTVTMRRGGQKPEAGAYKADPKKDPAQIDIIPPEKNGPPAYGIYKVDGDTLTLAVIPGKDMERPKKRESPAGSMVMLMTFKRAKKD